MEEYQYQSMRPFYLPVVIAVGGLFLPDVFSTPSIPAIDANISSLAVSDKFVSVKAPFNMLRNMLVWGLAPSCPSGVIIAAILIRM